MTSKSILSPRLNPWTIRQARLRYRESIFYLVLVACLWTPSWIVNILVMKLHQQVKSQPWGQPGSSSYPVPATKLQLACKMGDLEYASNNSKWLWLPCLTVIKEDPGQNWGVTPEHTYGHCLRDQRREYLHNREFKWGEVGIGSVCGINLASHRNSDIRASIRYSWTLNCLRLRHVEDVYPIDLPWATMTWVVRPSYGNQFLPSLLLVL